MKKHTILIKSVYITPDQHKRYKDISKLLEEPSTQVALDRLMEFCNESGISYKEWNIRWVDTIGERTMVDTTYGLYKCSKEHLDNTFKKYKRKYNELLAEYDKLRWYAFFKKEKMRKQMKELEGKIEWVVMCYDWTFTDTYISHRREWFLDIYY